MPAESDEGSKGVRSLRRVDPRRKGNKYFHQHRGPKKERKEGITFKIKEAIL